MKKVKKGAFAIRKRSPAAAYANEPSIVLHARFSKESVDGDKVHSCSPLEFHTFIPWVCKEWRASTAVLIARKSQESFVKGRRSTKHVRSMPDVSSFDDSGISGSYNKTLSPENDIVVPVTAYYDAKQHLVEISIVGSKVVPSRQIIRAFSLSVPYHTKLTRFTFRRSGLTATLVYEINKLLPISNISEIIFDDSYVREGNYYILLEQNSQLKYLSLNRCKINDEICKKIFDKLHFETPAGNTLKILELGSNEITDDAAIFIGSVLRSNRCLVHLNLSGNKITDCGFIPILDSLMEFPMNSDERNTMRRRKITYLQSKEAVYARCLSDLKSGILNNLDSSITSRKELLKRLRTTKTKSQQHGVEEDAEIMAKEILGEFNDPFSNNDVEYRNGSIYSKGNLVLCSINIAYNDLSYLSVRKLWEVLQYQDGMSITRKSDKDTGLIRITLDGNKIPQTCSELDGIEFYLKKVIQSKTKLGFKKSNSFLQRKFDQRSPIISLAKSQVTQKSKISAPTTVQ